MKHNLAALAKQTKRVAQWIPSLVLCFKYYYRFETAEGKKHKWIHWRILLLLFINGMGTKALHGCIYDGWPWIRKFAFVLPKKCFQPSSFLAAFFLSPPKDKNIIGEIDSESSLQGPQSTEKVQNEKEFIMNENDDVCDRQKSFFINGNAKLKQRMLSLSKKNQYFARTTSSQRNCSGRTWNGKDFQSSTISSCRFMFCQQQIR